MVSHLPDNNNSWKGTLDLSASLQSGTIIKSNVLCIMAIHFNFMIDSLWPGIQAKIHPNAVLRIDFYMISSKNRGLNIWLDI